MNRSINSIRFFTSIFILAIVSASCTNEEIKSEDLLGLWIVEDVDQSVDELMKSDEFVVGFEFLEKNEFEACNDFNDCGSGTWKLKGKHVDIELESKILIGLDIDQVSENKLEGKITFEFDSTKYEGQIVFSREKMKDDDTRSSSTSSGSLDKQNPAPESAVEINDIPDDEFINALDEAAQDLNKGK